MATCQNCRSFVTEQYARVFTPEEVDQPRCCPNCEDLIRDPDNTIRERKT